MEEWKAIEGYEGYYEVSNTGRVRSLERYVTRSDGVVQKRCAKIKAQTKNIDGYMTVHLCMFGDNNRVPVHRLVAKAFVSGYSEDLEVDHLDTNRTNNNYTNLEWVTHEENIRRAIERGNHVCLKDVSGENNPNYGNHVLSKRYALNPELSKQKQGRPGLQNGRATKIIMTDADGREYEFQMIKSCAEYLIQNKYTKSRSTECVSCNISSAIKNKSTYLGFYYKRA